MSPADRDTPLLDDLGLSLAAEQELETGADLSAVRSRLMTAALEESDAIADTEHAADEASELSVALVVPSSPIEQGCLIELGCLIEPGPPAQKPIERACAGC